jgi:hypothetical protein
MFEMEIPNLQLRTYLSIHNPAKDPQYASPPNRW